MAEEFLNRANVVASLQEMSGEGVAQGVARRGLVNSGGANGLLEGPLEHGLVQVVAAPLA
jgi:hypothetical protein